MTTGAIKATEPAEPRRLGRYALFGAIAAGGMATVHLGRLVGPIGFSRLVAIKRLHPQFAKDQLVLFTRETYMHPNVQLPAYEGEFSHINQPVHAWAVWRVFLIYREQHGGYARTA